VHVEGKKLVYSILLHMGYTVSAEVNFKINCGLVIQVFLGQSVPVLQPHPPGRPGLPDGPPQQYFSQRHALQHSRGGWKWVRDIK